MRYFLLRVYDENQPFSDSHFGFVCELHFPGLSSQLVISDLNSAKVLAQIR